MATRLIRLRGFLHAAQASASDQTSTGRHAAVIALDGACELAMGLVAAELVLSPANGINGMPKLLSRLTEKLGDRWSQEGSKGFRELHRARNAAQHDGTTPAAEHIPVWAAETERFTKSLIAAAFGLELDEVFAADAVATPAWRELLLTAERQAAAGEIRESLLSSKRAFVQARQSFAAKRRTSKIPTPSPTANGMPGIEELSNGLDLLQTFVDVAMFTPDPSEWVWLETVTPTHDVAEDALSRADAQRGLTFVLGWILRYESFAARYLEFDELYRPPDSPNPYAHYDLPRIQDLGRAPAFDQDDMPAYAVELADVPPDWDFWLINACGTVDLNDMHIRSNNNERLIVIAPDGTTSEDLWAVIRAVMVETHRLFCDSLTTKRAGLDERKAAAAAYQAALEELQLEAGTPEVIAEGLWTEGVALHVLIPPPADIDAFQLERQVNEILREHPAAVRIDQAGVYVDPSVLPATELVTAVQQAIATIRARRESDAQSRQTREVTRTATLDALRELAGVPAADH